MKTTVKKTIAITISTIFIPLFVFFLFNSTNEKVNAFGIRPAKIERSVLPGQLVEETLTIGNIDPMVFGNVSVKLVDYKIKDDGGKAFLAPGESTPDGMSEWVQGEKMVDIEPTGTGEMPYSFKIDVPEDASPGTHKLAVLLSQSPKSLEGDTEVGVSARVAIFVYYTIAGDTEANLELLNFNLNDELYKEGIYEFVITLKNTGNIALSPSGKIEIYQNDKRIKKIAEITEDVNGEVSKTGYINYIRFNSGSSTILPETNKTYREFVENLLLEPGVYTAKLNLEYKNQFDEKSENQVITDEIQFDISRNLLIDDLRTNFFNASFPVNFHADIINNGPQTANVEGSLTIYDIFGRVTQQIPIEKLTIESNDSTTLEDISWELGSAFGYYTATLRLNLINSSIVTTESAGFIFMSWWQIIIALAVAVLLVLGIYKFTKSYLKMRKKVEKLEKDQ
jgi:hypothetical protein